MARFIRLIQKYGFTLAELSVVVIVTGAIAALAVPRLMSQAEIVRSQEAKMHLLAIYENQKDYYREQGRYRALSSATAFSTANIPEYGQADFMKDFSNAKGLNNTIVKCGGTSVRALASMESRKGNYTLNILDNGGLCCTPCASNSDVCSRINGHFGGCSYVPPPIKLP